MSEYWDEITALDPLSFLAERFGTEDEAKRPISHEFTDRMRPSNANSRGDVFGGDILYAMDEKASIVAERYAETDVVTASVGNMSFEEPVYTDDVLVMGVSVDYVGRTSMTVSVDVYAEDIQADERRETGSAYLTFVALDDNEQPIEVPDLDLQTPEEYERYDRAAAFRDRMESEI